MKDPPDRPLLADVSEQFAALGEELRETFAARWELARLEIEVDLRSLARLAVFWSIGAVAALTALPLAVAALAEALSGSLGIARAGWLLILAAALLILALGCGYCAWRRFRRKFVGLRETIEELREDAGLAEGMAESIRPSHCKTASGLPTPPSSFIPHSSSFIPPPPAQNFAAPIARRMVSRIRSGGPSRPVNSLNCRDAWRTNISTPVIVRQLRLRASFTSSVFSGL